MILTELWWILARWPKRERVMARQDIANREAFALGVPVLSGAQRRSATAPDGTHVYLSTGCFHNDHAYCKGAVARKAGAKRPASCKFCAAPCVCPCHKEGS